MNDRPLLAQAIRNLPEPVGVTAKLTLNYRAPTHADQVCMIRFPHYRWLTELSPVHRHQNKTRGTQRT
jgi:hypothetical protein